MNKEEEKEEREDGENHGLIHFCVRARIYYVQV